MELPVLKIGDLTAKLPIIQGGMGVGISLSGLASAVAQEGGIGVIATVLSGMNEPNFVTNPIEADINGLRKEIRQARSKSDGILGVNVMVAVTNHPHLIKTSIEEHIDIIFSGAGLPLDLPKYLNGDTHTKLAPIVSSGRAATLMCKRWLSKFQYVPDAFVVEGPLAGGHLGLKREQIPDPEFALEKLIPEVLEAVRPFEEQQHKTIPIIAAGGIFTGADIYKFLQLGAAGVQMATRFVATHECDASLAFKQAYLNAKEDDIVIINSPVGMPGRAIRNKFLDDVAQGKKMPFACPYQCITTCDYQHSPYCIALALMNAKKGRLQHGFAFTGQNAYRVEQIVSVHDLIAALKQEFQLAVSGEKGTIYENI
jgi:nitronate monooxygenase